MSDERRSELSGASPRTDRPRVVAAAKRSDVPVFNCIVYVRCISGRVHGRVANLAGLAADGSSERDVLSKLIADFKRMTASYVERGETIPWIEPPAVADAGEQRRPIPVHL